MSLRTIAIEIVPLFVNTFMWNIRVECTDMEDKLIDSLKKIILFLGRIHIDAWKRNIDRNF